MILNQGKQDKIYNALLVGMSIDDAYIYAGLTPEEIADATEDTDLQYKWHRLSKEYEFGLLDKLSQVIDKQSRMGKEAALTWMLEKINPRYSSKPQPDTGHVHLHLDNSDPSALDTVKVFKPND